MHLDEGPRARLDSRSAKDTMKKLYDIVPRRLEGTSLQGFLEGMHRIYQRIENAQTAWTAASPYRCPEGCGTCCETFEPDILDAEAYYLAAFLVQARRDAGASSRAGWGEHTSAIGHRGCILSDPSDPYHCTVYEGRPLICRLFAFSGDRGKDGTIRYRPCRHMREGGSGTLGEVELLQLHGTLPPAMGDLAAEADLLSPESCGERRPLREVLPEALAKVRFLSDLAAFSDFAAQTVDKDDGDNDNDGPPIPAAS